MGYALIIDDLPLQDPYRVSDVRGVFLTYTLERPEIESALEFLEHRLIALSFVLECFIPGQDVLGALDDCLLETSREQLNYVVRVVIQRREFLTIRGDEQEAHLVR